MHTIIFFKEKCLDYLLFKIYRFCINVMQETKKIAVD